MKVARIILDPAVIVQACRAGFALQPLVAPIPNDATLVRAAIDPVTGSLVLHVASAGFPDADALSAPVPVVLLNAAPAALITEIVTRTGTILAGPPPPPLVG